MEEERLNDAVNALFYAGEAAVVAIAEQNAIDTKRHHGLKADAAAELYKKGVLGEDYGPVLRILNQARKDIWYEGEEPELNGELEDLVAKVEAACRGGRGGRMSGLQLSEQLSDAGWARRMRDDRDRAARCQAPEQRVITATVMSRAVALGASGFALTGSTARERRTAISDLDYHVIGRRPNVSDLPGDVDVVATSVERFRSRLLEGDDFVQWTLRCGCILHDTGPMRDAVRLIADTGLVAGCTPQA